MKRLRAFTGDNLMTPIVLIIEGKMAYLAPASSGQDYDYLFKVILIGDANVGKSSLISQFCNEKFMDTVASTVGVDFYIKEFNINGKNVKVRYS